ncbi:SEC-C metal-binding domain-containing protein [Alcaligenes faecalis subsp. phenolicus]|uniref:SEC-C metal-binding domain-containing protein n=1 Tax=Alcaligenes nematophilus TaxID=2994643 RepID=UPI002AA3A863|nr:SEC-C metal-binding domain-containing protein [Alcaligenes phenolicus]
MSRLKIELKQKKPKGLRGAQFKNVGRNQPCPCESGKKYKHCCGRHDLSPAERLLRDLQNNRQNQYYETGGYRT